jgi:endonuclease I
LIPAEVNSARGNMPYKDWARNNRSSYAKNEAAMKGLISLETIMEIEIVKMIENPNRIQ